MILSILGFQPPLSYVDRFRSQAQKDLRDYISTINPYYINNDQVFSKYRILQVLHKGYCKIRHAFYKTFSKKYVETLDLYQKALKHQIRKDHLNHLTVKPKKMGKTEFSVFFTALVSKIFPPFTIEQNDLDLSVHHGEATLDFSSDTELRCEIKGYQSTFQMPRYLKLDISQAENRISFPDQKLKGEVLFKGIAFPVMLNHVSLNATHICVDVELYDIGWLAQKILSSLGKTSQLCVKTRKEKLPSLFSNVQHITK